MGGDKMKELDRGELVGEEELVCGEGLVDGKE